MKRLLRNTFWYFVVSLASIIAYHALMVLGADPPVVFGGIAALDVALSAGIATLRERVRF